MNIFVLDEDPTVAAKYHCDKHVVKMVLESAQLLSTTCRILDGIDPRADFSIQTGRKIITVYKATHINHPCAIWARKSTANYRWLGSLALSLCEEYTFRYGKRHKSQDLIEALQDPPEDLKKGNLTNFALAMPENLRLGEDAIGSYRRYYIEDKLKNIQCKWTKRETPFWIPIGEN